VPAAAHSGADRLRHNAVPGGVAPGLRGGTAPLPPAATAKRCRGLRERPAIPGRGAGSGPGWARPHAATPRSGVSREKFSGRASGPIWTTTVDGTNRVFPLLRGVPEVLVPFRATSGGGPRGAGTRPRTRKYFDPRLDFVRYW